MGAYIWPLPGYSRISSPFGPRNCPFHGRETHTGIDLPAPYGTRILAARAGTVTTAGSTAGYGNLVIINHGSGIQTYYAHCSSIVVKRGQQVSAGQLIAKVGSTGPSTGNHLHFGVKVNGGFHNPLNYVKSSDTAAKYTGAKGVSASAGSSKTSGRKTSAGSTKTTSKEITTVKVVSTTGKTGNQDNSLRTQGKILTAGAEVLVQNGSAVFQPVLKGDITLEYERKGAPGKLTFTAVKDSTLKMSKGNPVRFRYNNRNLFFGYYFTRKREDDKCITITCYDQLRYLKNKDVRSYKKKTYSQLLKMIAKEYKLECGTIENTKYVIPARIEDGTLFDILGNASDLTVSHTKKLYVLYDDFGKLTLKNIESMKLPILLDADTAESLEYESGIDSNVYNRIKLYTDNEEKGVREVHVRNNTAKQKKWGILQYVEEVDGLNKKEIKQKAKVLADYYGAEQRKLSIRKAFGDVRVRGGSSLVVQLNLGDTKISNYMLVERVKHTFSMDTHIMDLDLAGIKGEFHV